MPSPFPGMDPYLEGPTWMSVHSQLVAEIARQLAPKLRPRYLALTTERFVVDTPDDVAVATVYPDVAVQKSGRPAPSSAAALTVAAPLQLPTVVPEKVPHTAVEIRDAEQRQLVTAIEVLSPSNKRGDGRKEYLRKRRRILLSAVHLIEIDLLREGQRVPMRKPLPAAPYFVFVGRSENRPLVDIWPVRLQDRLPTVPVPLLPGDADVELDLQLALTTIYDALGYDLAFNYTNPPAVSLADDDATWADDLLRASKLRP